MLNRVLISLSSLVLCTTAFAAHIVTQTRVDSTLVQRTDTYANAAGDLRMDERRYGSSSSMSAAAAAGESAQKVEYHLGKIEDSTLYQSNGQAIVMLEGKICRRLTADSAPPPGLGVPGMNLGDANKQMAEAMKKAGSAFEEAMNQAKAEGMSAEQQRAIESFAKPFTDSQSIKPRDTLQVQPLGARTTVGRYNAEGYLVSDLDGNEKHRVWVVPTGKVAGGKDVRNAMQGMIDVYTQYMEKMGGAALMDTALVALFDEGDLADSYPVRIEDLDSGEITEVIEAHSGGPNVEFYPQCEEKDMFGM